MILLVATMKVAPENHAAFEAIMTDLCQTVRANEPGVRFYQLAKSDREENTYQIVELYEDQAAFDSHVATAWFQAAYPKFGALLSEKPTLSRLTTVG